MKYLEGILQLLRDTHWHSVEEIKSKVSLPPDRLDWALTFLQEQSFVDGKNGKLRITSSGLKFLELPS